MKEIQGIVYSEVRVTCSCGHSFVTNSTANGPIVTEVCSQCHPFYTGQHKASDRTGRIESFSRKYGLQK